jgi:hypothetical protein
MKNNQIQALIEMFQRKYPIQITNIDAFRKEAQYINTEYADQMENIVDRYVNYIKIKGIGIEDPINFIKFHSYQKDFNAYPDYENNYDYDNDGTFISPRDKNIQALYDEWERNIKQHFRYDTNNLRYKEIIPEAHFLFTFEPLFYRDNGELKVREDLCKVNFPHCPEYEVKVFNTFTPARKQLVLMELECERNLHGSTFSTQAEYHIAKTKYYADKGLTEKHNALKEQVHAEREQETYSGTLAGVTQKAKMELLDRIIHQEKYDGDDYFAPEVEY